MNASHWQSELEKYEQQVDLLLPTSLQQRMEVLKALSQLMRFGRNRYGIREGFSTVLPRAISLQNKLEDVNNRLFDQLREQIQQHGLSGQAFRDILDAFTEYRPGQQNVHHAIDGLSFLLNGLFQTSTAPEPELDAVMDMIHLEMTPLSAILELVDRAALTADDTFVDIGSGQGQVCLLVHLLTSVHAMGIDIEPAYVQRAQNVSLLVPSAMDAVQFIQADARYADFSKGTAFFMYTPFVGKIFHSVIKNLRETIMSLGQADDSAEIVNRRILICTHGDITLELAQLPWLRVQQTGDLHPSRLAIFEPVQTLG